MLTYQVRRRGVYAEPLGTPLLFPNDAELVFHFTPAAPFGGTTSRGYTAVHGKEVTTYFNSNTGRSLVESSEPLDPVDVSLRLPDGTVRFVGPSCTVSFRCESRLELQSMLESYYYLLPLLLNVDLQDAPIIERVTGCVGSTQFHWGVIQPTSVSFDATTTEQQEKRIVLVVQRMSLLDERRTKSARRLAAALHWFHIACRLTRASHSPWEFLSEVILNYAKILEVLFPATRGRSIDSARSGLNELGFSDAEIEAWYIPALALRNNIDVAHVSLAVFNQKDLEVIHEYSWRAEIYFRALLSRVLERIAAGELELPSYEDPTPSRDALTVIERLRDALGGQSNHS